jgi:hypothetical protein
MKESVAVEVCFVPSAMLFVIYCDAGVINTLWAIVRLSSDV